MVIDVAKFYNPHLLRRSDNLMAIFTHTLARRPINLT